MRRSGESIQSVPTASLLVERSRREGSHAGQHQRRLRSLEDRDSRPGLTRPFASSLSPLGVKFVQRSPTDLPERSFGNAMGARVFALLTPSGGNNKRLLHLVTGHRSRKRTLNHRLAGAEARDQSGNEVDAGTVRPFSGSRQRRGLRSGSRHAAPSSRGRRGRRGKSTLQAAFAVFGPHR